MTQDQAATICGVRRENWSRWEGGKSYPDLKQLLMVADGFGVSLDVMFGRQSVEQTTKRHPVSHNSKWIQAVEMILASGNRNAIVGLKANIEWCLSYLEHGESTSSPSGENQKRARDAG